jgi:hypothetical protein
MRKNMALLAEYRQYMRNRAEKKKEKKERSLPPGGRKTAREGTYYDRAQIDNLRSRQTWDEYMQQRKADMARTIIESRGYPRMEQRIQALNQMVERGQIDNATHRAILVYWQGAEDNDR